MLSNISIVSLFIEMFAGGILFAGSWHFLFRRFFLDKDKAHHNKKTLNFFTGLVFLFSALYVAGILYSQFQVNLGHSLQEILWGQKFISVCLVLASIAIWFFVVERFRLSSIQWLPYLISVASIVVIYRIIVSPAQIVLQMGIIEPIVRYELIAPTKSLWNIAWLIASLCFFWQAIIHKKEKYANLLWLGGSSTLLFVISFFFYYSYITMGYSALLLCSWIIQLIAITGFYIVCLIPFDSKLAQHPLNFFRSSILYKLLLIFVLLVMILIEITTLATINISKQALSSAIKKAQHEQAKEIAGQVNLLVNNSIKDLKKVGTGPFLANLDKTEQIASSLSLLQQTSPTFKNLMILDMSGKVRFMLKKNKEDFSAVPAKDIIKGAVKNNIFYSPLEQDKNYSFYFIAAAPIVLSNKGYRGILAANIDLDPVQKIISATKVGNNGTAYIVSSQGNLLAHPDDKRAKMAEDVSQNDVVQKVISGADGSKEFYDEFGEKMVGAYFPIKDLGWGIVVQEPVQDAYFEIRNVETNSIIFVMFGLVVIVFVGVFFALNISNSIKTVTLGAEAVGQGNLDYTIKLSSLDEIGQLADSFNHMTRELQQSQSQLLRAEKLAALGTLSAGMAHEIKNPLVSIRTFTELLPYKFEDAKFRERFMSIIPHEIDRINKITESLLKFGRPTKPEFSSCDVNSILEDIMTLTENQLKKNNVFLDKDLTQLPNIVGDKEQLFQVFLNIILNSIQAMPHGGKLIMKTDSGEVKRVDQLTPKEAQAGFEMLEKKKLPESAQDSSIPVVFIEISDAGMGIPEENLQSVFDPFFTTKASGTGMGLAISLRIIEEHRGSIKVKSEIGKGTTFIITLPVQKDMI